MEDTQKTAAILSFSPWLLCSNLDDLFTHNSQKELSPSAEAPRVSILARNLLLYPAEASPWKVDAFHGYVKR